MPRVPAILILSSALTCSLGAQAELVLSGAWVRAMPPTQARTAAYMDVHNTSDKTVVIQGASADAAPRVELHTTVEVDGMRRMQPVPELKIAPGEHIAFRPGGLHLMLMDMPSMPAIGDTVQLCLQTDGEAVCAAAPVQRDQSGGHQH